MNKFLKNKKFLYILAVILVGLLLLGGWSSLKPIKPQKGEFIKVGKMSIPRYNHKAILLDDGRVLIINGMTITKSYEGGTISTEIYNPETKNFKSLGNMNALHGQLSATKLNNGEVLLAGCKGGKTSKKAELFDPKTNKFRFTGELNYPRSEHTATLLNDGRVLLSGGDYTVYPFNNENIPDEIYDPKTGKFTITTSLNVPRFKHSAVLLKDGRILILGGYTKGMILSSIEIFDPKTNKYELAGNMNITRAKPNVYVLKNGNVVISGGIGEGHGDTIFLREIEIYNPKTNKFKVITKRQSIPRMPTEVLLKDDRILFTGGDTGVGLSLQWYRTSEIYNPATNKFTKGNDMKLPRAGHVATLLKDGNVLITGSYGTGRTSELYINK